MPPRSKASTAPPGGPAAAASTPDASAAVDAAVAAVATVDVRASVDPARRVERFTRGGDLTSVAALLVRWRDEILERWLDATAEQPFHEGRRERAVADHIPQLFDGLAALLRRPAAGVTHDTSRAASDSMTQAATDDAAVLTAAREHARIRLEQGLGAPDIATEFRLLRQEIGRALRAHLDEDTAVTDLMAAELLVNDALDGAVYLALSARDLYDAEHRRLGQLLHAEQVRLESALREKDALLGILAHDLKNPLATIKGTVQLLQRRVSGGKLTSEHLGGQLETIHTSVTRMTAQLNELLDVSRVAEGGLLKLTCRPTDLVAIVREVAAAQQLATQSHRIVVDAPEPAVVGEWDAARLTRVVDNLLSNAVKYSVAGGEIAVRVSRDEAGWAVVTVQDQGIGIPAADATRIFERLQRASNVADIPGAGIGLAASRHIAELHGGTITFESEMGRGSTFTMRLPLVTA